MLARILWRTLENGQYADENVSLGAGAKLSLKNVNGNITVSAWDQAKAEVKVIKRALSDRSPQYFLPIAEETYP